MLPLPSNKTGTKLVQLPRNYTKQPPNNPQKMRVFKVWSVEKWDKNGTEMLLFLSVDGHLLSQNSGLYGTSKYQGVCYV